MAMKVWVAVICTAGLCMPVLGQTTQPGDPPIPTTLPADIDALPKADEWLEMVAWSRQVGSGANDYIDDLTVGPDGALYVCGTAHGRLGQRHEGGSDGWMAAFDPEGNELWRRQIGTTSNDYLCEVTIGDDEMLYFAGASEGDFLRQNQDYRDLLVTQCDLDGNEMWTVSLGERGNEWPDAIAVDPNGDVFVSVRALPGEGFRPSDRAIIVKLDGRGSEQWRRTITEYRPVVDVQVTPDGAGGCVVTGGGVDADGLCEVYVLFLDQDGAEVRRYTHSVGPGWECYNSVRDVAGNTYFVGRQPGTPRRTFVLKLSPTGEELWLTDVVIPGVANFDGGPRVGAAVDNVAVDAAGNVYVTGKIDTRRGGSDTFVAVYDPQGHLRCAWNLGPDVPTLAWELTLRPDGVLIITGETPGRLTSERWGRLSIFVSAYRFGPATADSAPPEEPAVDEPTD